jgi:hypothetical protein
MRPSGTTRPHQPLVSLEALGGGAVPVDEALRVGPDLPPPDGEVSALLRQSGGFESILNAPSDRTFDQEAVFDSIGDSEVNVGFDPAHRTASRDPVGGHNPVPRVGHDLHVLESKGRESHARTAA